MVGRGARLLLILALTGCAVEPPRPLPASLAPSPTLVPPPIISRFGDSRGAGGGLHASRHSGVDIRAPVGTPVLAAADGVVVRVGRQPLAGKLIVVSHADDLTTVYYHLSEIDVVAGQAVRRGEVIGRAGMTGNATTPHLHFGVCRRPEGRCGDRIDAGWEDPTEHWAKGNPCSVKRSARPAPSSRLTYPVPCAG